MAEAPVQTDIVHDKVAEQLENEGLWRRAASRWLAVQQETLSNKQWEWLRKRRNYCLSRTKRSPERKLDIYEIRRTATETQLRMGIDDKRPIRK